MTPDLITSPPPIFSSLIVGLLLATAFQLLLTSLGIAAGVSAMRYAPAAPGSPSQEKTGGNPGFWVGMGTLLTVNLGLSGACFLAIKLNQVSTVSAGAVLGVVIWAGYFLVLTWLSTQAVGSVLGTIAGTLTAGLRGLVGTVQKALRPRSENPELAVLQNQLDSTEGAIHSLQSALDTVVHDRERLEETVRSSPQPQPQVDAQQIRREVMRLLQDPTVPSPAPDSNQDDRPSAEEPGEQRGATGRSQAQPEGNEALTAWLQSASPDELLSDRLMATVQQFLTSSEAGEEIVSQLRQNAMPLFKHLRHRVLQRVDLSDQEVGRVLQQIQTWFRSPEEGEFPTEVGEEPHNPIQADVEDYLLNAESWQLNRKTIQQEFQEIIYDPEADPELVRQQLKPLDPHFLRSVLEQRQDLSHKKLAKAVGRLESARQAVLRSLNQHIDAANSQRAEVWQALETYVGDRTQKLTARTIQRQIKSMAKDLDGKAVPSFDREQVEGWLVDRQDLSEKRIQKVLEHLEKHWNDRMIPDAPMSTPSPSLPKRWALRASAQTQDVWQTLMEYLHQADLEDLNLETLGTHLAHWVEKARHQWGSLDELKDAVLQWDQRALVAILLQREELSEEEAHQFAEQVKTVAHGLVDRTTSAQKSMQQAVSTLIETLPNSLGQSWDEGLKQTLTQALSEAQEVLGASGNTVGETVGNYLQTFSQEAQTLLQEAREGASETLTHQVRDRFDTARSSILNQLNQLQHQAQQQVEELKLQAQLQAESARKSIAVAAWWLFSIALTSVASSAAAGAIAVGGMDWVQRVFAVSF